MKRNLLSIAIGALLIFIVGLLLFVFQVRKSEVVVVTRFGASNRTITDPGPHWRLPWPIEEVHRLDQRVQNFEDKFTPGNTADQFNLLTSVYIGWKITDPKVFFPKFFRSGTDPIAEAEKQLDPLASNAKTGVIGKHPLLDLLSPAGEGNQFVAVEKEIQAKLTQQVEANNYGLEIVFLGIKKLGLPESVTQKVFDRMQSERKVLAQRLESEGEAKAITLKSEGDRKAAEMLTVADSQATEIRGKGEAEAAKSLAVFKQNPELARFLFDLTALENSLKDRSTLIFDQHTYPFDVLGGSWTNLCK